MKRVTLTIVAKNDEEIEFLHKLIINRITSRRFSMIQAFTSEGENFEEKKSRIINTLLSIEDCGSPKDLGIGFIDEEGNEY